MQQFPADANDVTNLTAVWLPASIAAYNKMVADSAASRSGASRELQPVLKTPERERRQRAWY